VTQIGPESEKLVTVALGRAQACIDALVGSETISATGFFVQPPQLEAENNLRVLAYLQDQLRTLEEVTELRSPSAYADATAWLIREMQP
jgi:hypothetical protein